MPSHLCANRYSAKSVALYIRGSIKKSNGSPIRTWLGRGVLGTHDRAKRRRT